MDTIPENVDSKFRFVLLAATRAEQMMRGAQPRVEATSHKPSRIAMEEIRQNVVAWDYGPPPVEPEEEAAGEAAAEGESLATEGPSSTEPE